MEHNEQTKTYDDLEQELEELRTKIDNLRDAAKSKKCDESDNLVSSSGVPVYVYIRVSTKDQSLDAQRNEILEYCKLRGWSPKKIFSDIRSGKSISERPGFTKMLKELDTNPHGIKSIVIQKLDRIGRNLKDLLELFDLFNKLGIGIVSLHDSLDTSTPGGKMAFHVIASLTEYERDVMLERTRVGREYAMEHKTAVFGRRKIHVNMNLVRELLSRGVTKARIAKDLHISRGTLYSAIVADKKKPLPEPEK
jgi:DNA invertase Pin-like site-specific DNA recombinase